MTCNELVSSPNSFNAYRCSRTARDGSNKCGIHSAAAVEARRVKSEKQALARGRSLDIAALRTAASVLRRLKHTDISEQVAVVADGLIAASHRESEEK